MKNHLWHGLLSLLGLGAFAISGAVLWRELAHGDAFYHFQGLRQFKESFDPIWSTRYLAAPSGIQTARVMVDLLQLIGKSREDAMPPSAK